MFKLHDRIKETSYTQGTGDLILRGALPGFVTFSSEYNDDSVFFYCITNNTQFEVGLGQYISSTNSLKRIEVYNSTTKSFINWGKGLKEVYVTYAADKAVHKDYLTEYNPNSEEIVLALWKGSNSIGNIGSNYYYNTNNQELVLPNVSSEFIDVETLRILNTGRIDWAGVEQTKASVDLKLDYTTGIQEVIQESGYADHTLRFKKQIPGTFLAGPSNNCDGKICEEKYPTFRPLVSSDLPNINSENVNYNPKQPEDWNNIPTNIEQALDIIIKYSEKCLQKEENLNDLNNKALARHNLGVLESGECVKNVDPRLKYNTINREEENLPSGYYHIVNSGEDLFIKTNISGEIKSLKLGTLN